MLLKHSTANEIILDELRINLAEVVHSELAKKMPRQLELEHALGLRQTHKIAKRRIWMQFKCIFTAAVRYAFVYRANVFVRVRAPGRELLILFLSFSALASAADF